jgi:trehalose 6-phosphate phosphatase
MATETLPSALESFAEIRQRLRGRAVVLCLDYDGTLTPIVERPEDAVLRGRMRPILESLAERCLLAIVSGRDAMDVRGRVGVERAYYAGSHGFDILGPEGFAEQHPEGVARLPSLDAAQRELEERLRGLPGAQVDRKRFSIAVHYRRVPEKRTQDVDRIVEEVAERHTDLRVGAGKMVWDFQPRVDWHKGRAVEWLLREIAPAGSPAVPVFLGDDLTDEDAFRAVASHAPPGPGILVAEHPRPTDATFLLRDVREVEAFLERLSGSLDDV